MATSAATLTGGSTASSCRRSPKVAASVMRCRQSSLPWEMPWRVIMVGDGPASDRRIESRHQPRHSFAGSRLRLGGFGRAGCPGAGGPTTTVRRTSSALRRYVDLAAEFGWEYTLVDANWQVHGEEAIRDLVGLRRSARRRHLPLVQLRRSPQPGHRTTPRPDGGPRGAPRRDGEARRLGSRRYQGGLLPQ